MFIRRGIILVVSILYIKLTRKDEFDSDNHVKGKNVLITGASSGIGEELAYQYAQMGANVFLTARRGHLLEKVITKCKTLSQSETKFDYLAADMEQYDITSKDVINTAVTSLGGLDHIILNHAFLPQIRRWTGCDEQLREFERQLDVNLISYIHLASHALPYLRKSAGKIGVVGSMAGKIDFPYGSGYSTAKFSLDGFFSSLRQELKNNKENITVTVCFLAWIDTAMAKSVVKDSSEIHFNAPVDFTNTTETAITFIKATSLGQRELYFPPLFGSTYLRKIIPVIRHL